MPKHVKRDGAGGKKTQEESKTGKPPKNLNQKLPAKGPEKPTLKEKGQRPKNLQKETKEKPESISWKSKGKESSKRSKPIRSNNVEDGASNWLRNQPRRRI